MAIFICQNQAKILQIALALALTMNLSSNFPNISITMIDRKLKLKICFLNNINNYQYEENYSI